MVCVEFCLSTTLLLQLATTQRSDGGGGRGEGRVLTRLGRRKGVDALARTDDVRR